jgi:5-methylcytosine-specific restriction endonuclease McrA
MKAAEGKYYRKRRGHIARLSCRKWRKTHRHIVAALIGARRAKAAATLTPRNKIRITKIYRRAAELRQWFDVVVDHIIPIAKGGKHHPDNLQIIYKRENQIKGARLDYLPTVIFS